MYFQTYSELNDLLSGVLFTGQNRNRPAYIELDEEVCSVLAESIECNVKEVITCIQKITSDYYAEMANPSEVFRFAANSIRQWRKKISQDSSLSYPEIPLLVCLTSAALEMGGDSEFNANAYYPRLAAILKVMEKDDLAESYREYSQVLWGNWNYWLDSVLNAERGIGTAYSIGAWRHVGYALSQALVRSGDRKKFPSLFRKNGLIRNTSISNIDMQHVLDDWIASVDVYGGYESAPSRPFQNLWKHAEARPRMSEIVCRELELWDGRIPQVRTPDGILKDDIQIALEATISNFGGVQVKFSFGVSGLVGKKESKFKILDSDGQYREISMVNDSSGWMYPNVAKLPISTIDLLEKSITGKFDESLEVTRAPKRIAVLRLDQTTRRFREIERAELHTRLMILVNDHRSNIEFVRDILLDSARIGFKEINSSNMKGIPENWVIFTEVELVQIPPQELLKKHVLLEALRPNRSGDLTISAGFQLPGNPPKWHKDFPIEIRSFVVGAHSLKLRVYQVVDDEQIQILEEKFVAETFIRSFDPGSFEDGRYEIKVYVDDVSDPFASKVLRVASSDTPDAVTWKRADRLVYAIGKHGSGLFSATNPDVISFDVIDGPFTLFDIDPVSTRPVLTNLPTDCWWSTVSKEQATAEQEFKLNTLGTSICFESGTHHWEIDAALPNSRRDGYTRSASSKVAGNCKNCGIKKMFPATHWDAQLPIHHLEENRRIQVRQTSKVDIATLPKVTELTVTWDMALDALMHLGGGSESYISAVAANIDSSALFRHNFINLLEDLGHIDIARDSDAQVIGWEINPSFAAVLEDEIHFLGYWPKRSKELLQEHFKSCFVVQKLEDSVSQSKLIGISVEELVAFCRQADLDINITENSHEIMISTLPRFLDALKDLPEKQAGLYEEVAKYDPKSNSWLPGNDFDGAGGYRLRSAYKTEYCIVTDDLEHRKIKSVSSSTAKHFEAINNFKRPLFGYVESSEQLFVPVGAPLPGLYQRAAVLASGSSPSIDSTGKLSVYESISSEFVQILTTKLGV